MLAEFMEYNPEMFQVIDSSSLLNNQLINIAFYRIPKHFLEDDRHNPMWLLHS